MVDGRLYTLVSKEIESSISLHVGRNAALEFAIHRTKLASILISDYEKWDKSNRLFIIENFVVGISAPVTMKDLQRWRASIFFKKSPSIF